ncbi:MAG: right-handed parallel beta-helix repeat-containing protein [candidate division Zixibacteria bacterium]|nr:right-handed parallel beta-helix repeat-containing protein [candidate division Zixibacteria bacterium]
MRRIIIVSVLSLCCGMASATTIHVPADQPTIQSGINASSHGDTVLVQPGTYLENIQFNGRNIVLGSMFLTTDNGSYISTTVIDGNAVGSVVRFVNGENSSAIITGFTIQNGHADKGAGILCEGTSPIISHNIIRNNTAVNNGNGAGISCAFESNPTISDNVIQDNTAEGDGGGIACYIANATISDNTITGNSANTGGGIQCGYCTNPSITNNTITENSSNSGAGGIFLFESNPDISDNDILNNEAGGGGGGIFCSYCTGPTISDNTISGNSAGKDGGAISLFDSDPAITGNTMNGNSADGDGGRGGGAIFFSYSDPVITNNIVSQNTTGAGGGGIESFESNPTISNNTISGNTSGVGGAISLSNSNATISYNVMARNQVLYEGGALNLWNSSTGIVSNTIVSNTAGLGGGAMFICNSSPTIDKCLVAFNSGMAGAITCAMGCPPSSPNLSCTNVFGNVGGDWVGCIASQASINGNFSLDPIFCDTASNDFSLFMSSPCTPAYSSCGELIGALDVGCPVPTALIDPDMMFVRFAYMIEPMMATITFGDFNDGHSASDIDPATILVNGSISPDSWTLVPHHPDFQGEVMEIIIPVRDFILGYGLMWDSTVHPFDVSGQFSGGGDFAIVGEVSLRGHRSGDLNADGSVNIADLTYLVTYLFLGGPPPPVWAVANVDGITGPAGSIDISDLTYLVAYLFLGGSVPVCE